MVLHTMGENCSVINQYNNLSYMYWYRWALNRHIAQTDERLATMNTSICIIINTQYKGVYIPLQQFLKLNLIKSKIPSANIYHALRDRMVYVRLVFSCSFEIYFKDLYILIALNKSPSIIQIHFHPNKFSVSQSIVQCSQIPINHIIIANMNLNRNNLINGAASQRRMQQGLPKAVQTNCLISPGPVMWYQKFEYAIGHWLQKAAEHMYGCVLCSPGCFSLFRGLALMDNNVMRTYATKPTAARHYLQYDQGKVNAIGCPTRKGHALVPS